MKSLSQIQQLIRGELPYLKEKYGVTRIRIFGSYARGEATEKSDVDLLIDMEKGRSLMALGGVQYHLQVTLGIKVDVAEFDVLHPVLKKEASNDLVSV